MSYGDEITASDGFEPDEDEFDSEDYDDELGSEDDADWDEDDDEAGNA
jgi:hypothetical protein